MILRIKNWDKHFENNRTRELKKLSWVPFPNKLDGDGYTELLEHKNGAAYFGCWCVICEVASKCDPRGTLLRDGGKPHNSASLSRITRFSQNVLEEAIKILLSIKWLESYDNPAGECDTKAAEGCRLPEWNGREGKEGKEGKTPQVDFVFPDSLNIPEFKSAWENWQQHRKEIKKPLTPQSIKMQMKEFTAWGPERAIKAIEFTIKKGWQGIKENENEQPSRAQSPIAPIKKSFDDIRLEIITKLEESDLAGGDSISRCLSKCNDLYRDIPKRNGVRVVDEAYEIFKHRNKKAI